MTSTVFIQNVSCTFNNEIIFQDLTLTLPAGKCICLLGPSGIGKTILLRFIAGLEKLPGKIFSDNPTPVHQQIAYMAQTDLLLPWLTAIQNAKLSQTLTGEMISQEKAQHLFQQVGLQGAENKFPAQLSGGMRQRVAFVRTLLQNKPILLMDEPFSAVDAITRFQLQTMTATFLKNRTTLLITHDPLEALRLADEIYILSGKPATLKKIFTLQSPSPRNANDAEIIHLQAKLFHALTQTTEIFT